MKFQWKNKIGIIVCTYKNLQTPPVPFMEIYEPCKHLSWNRCGIYVSRSCWDYVVKHVEMSSFLNLTSRKLDISTYFPTWPTNINITSVPQQVLAGKSRSHQKCFTCCQQHCHLCSTTSRILNFPVDSTLWYSRLFHPIRGQHLHMWHIW